MWGNRTIPSAGAIVAVCRLFNSLSPPVSYSTQSLCALRDDALHNALNSRQLFLSSASWHRLCLRQQLVCRLFEAAKMPLTFED